MTALALALLVSQVPPAAEPPEVALFAQWVQRNLITLSPMQGGVEVRQRERAFRLNEEDFVEAFTLVPEARALAQGAHESYVAGSRLQMAGLIAVGASVVPTLVAVLLPSALLLPLMIAGLALSGVGLVLTLVALPFMLTAQSKFFSAVATYDRGLLEQRPPGGGLTIPLP